MSHTLPDPVDIPRAIGAGLYCLFSHVKNNRLYYDTAFGEQFFVHTYHVPYEGLSRKVLGAELEDAMGHFNEDHSSAGGD